MQRVSIMRVDQLLRLYWRISIAPNSVVAIGPRRSSPCRAPLTKRWGREGLLQPMRMMCCSQAVSPHMPWEPKPNMLPMVDIEQMSGFESHATRIRLTRALYEPSRARVGLRKGTAKATRRSNIVSGGGEDGVLTLLECILKCKLCKLGGAK
jgi:hypothetical protein